MRRYWTKDFWHDDHPGADVIGDVFYSTNYFTERAVGIVSNYSRAVAAGSAAKGLWVFLAHQAVHAPITDVPQDEAVDATGFWDEVYGYMLHVLDR